MPSIMSSGAKNPDEGVQSKKIASPKSREAADFSEYCLNNNSDANSFDLSLRMILDGTWSGNKIAEIIMRADDDQ